jgi:hypothetical protein
MSGTREILKPKENADDDSSAGSRDSNTSNSDSDDRRFWRALKPSQEPAPATGKPIDLAGDMQDMSEHERESRRQALRSMLAVSEARQQGALRSRRPTFALGERLIVCSGELKNQQGTILDADFIHSRVYLQLDGYEEPEWVEFASVAAVVANQ